MLRIGSQNRRRPKLRRTESFKLLIVVYCDNVKGGYTTLLSLKDGTSDTTGD